MENNYQFEGIILVVLIVAFFGLSLWAWSSKRKPEFDEAASLPLEDEDLNENRTGEGKP